MYRTGNGAETQGETNQRRNSTHYTDNIEGHGHLFEL